MKFKEIYIFTADLSTTLINFSIFLSFTNLQKLNVFLILKILILTFIAKTHTPIHHPLFTIKLLI